MATKIGKDDRFAVVLRKMQKGETRNFDGLTFDQALTIIVPPLGVLLNRPEWTRFDLLREGFHVMTLDVHKPDSVFDEIAEERQRQDEKWGEQNHPSVDPVLMNRPGGCEGFRMCEEYGLPSASLARSLCDLRHKRGDGAWADIAVEELAEAIEAATINEADSRRELVQLGAVVCAWIDCIDRRGTDAEKSEAVNGGK